MALDFRFPNYHPSSYYNRAPRGYDIFLDIWRQIALASAYTQQTATPFSQQAKESSPQGSIKIATVLLKHYKPEEISLEVDSEKVILHGQHRFEIEDGFEKSEFMRVFKIPQGVDPTTVTSRTIITQDGGNLIIEGKKRREKKANDNKFEVKLDFRGFKPEDIKFHIRGNELTVTGKQAGRLSRDCSRHILLPDDVDLNSVTSRLSKEGLLTIEASRDRERTVDFAMETDELDQEPKHSPSADGGEVVLD